MQSNALTEKKIESILERRGIVPKGRGKKKWRSSVWEDWEGAIHVDDPSVEKLRKGIWRLIFEARKKDKISDSDTAWALARVQYELIHHFDSSDIRNKEEENE